MSDGYVVGVPANGTCSRCGRAVWITPDQLENLVGRIVAAEDGWITVVCAVCAPDLFAAG